MLQWIEVPVHTQPGKAELNAQILERIDPQLLSCDLHMCSDLHLPEYTHTTTTITTVAAASKQVNKHLRVLAGKKRVKSSACTMPEGCLL